MSWLVFCDGEGIPSFLVKVSTDPLQDEAIRCEYQNFSSIYGRLRECRSSVPRPVLLEELDGRQVLCETAVVGRPLGGRTFRRCGWQKRRRVGYFVSRALDWLGLFHAETNVAHVVIDDSFIKHGFREVVAGVMSRLGLELLGYERELESLPGRAAGFRGARIPVGAVHGDFTHANILLQDGSVAVVDWEDCQPRGLPFRDLFFLLCQLGLNYYGAMNWEQSFGRFFLEGEGDVQLRRMAEYARRAGFDPRILPLMLPQFLGEMLLAEPPEGRGSFLFVSASCLRVALELQRRVWH